MTVSRDLRRWLDRHGWISRGLNVTAANQLADLGYDLASVKA